MIVATIFVQVIPALQCASVNVDVSLLDVQDVVDTKLRKEMRVNV